ncbi:hypothetical protein SBRY_30566 [Actinacidiphila bryophytorum]|uniref:Uncharacterized protein n=1 Tax=Actinacidiphila bryophytorum TaxID=1436133 RepID=A0A9W4H199_9ACTN|nr:hypothetical protein SBRY_30566 [Actinacidiphila bryophytorum]
MPGRGVGALPPVPGRPEPDRGLGPGLRPPAASPHALGADAGSAERENPAQTLSGLGFGGTAFGIRTRDLRITRP